jgi:hypothetical protein
MHNHSLIIVTRHSKDDRPVSVRRTLKSPPKDYKRNPLVEVQPGLACLLLGGLMDEHHPVGGNSALRSTRTSPSPAWAVGRASSCPMLRRRSPSLGSPDDELLDGTPSCRISKRQSGARGREPRQGDTMMRVSYKIAKVAAWTSSTARLGRPTHRRCCCSTDSLPARRCSAT